MFTKATRKITVPKVCMIGTSGSGKTYSALEFARGYIEPGEKIALIDTENGSAGAYAGVFDFDAAQLSPPYTARDYITAIQHAQEAKYGILIIDSLSHAWAGEGGLLDKKAALDNRGGNQYANWAPISTEYNQLTNAILLSKIPIIVTLRSKMAYAQEVTDRGRQSVVRLGLQPVMRDNFEYDFYVVFDIAHNHTAMALKDRTMLYDGITGQINKNWGAKLREWSETGALPGPYMVEDTIYISFKIDGDTSEPINADQVARIKRSAKKRFYNLVMDESILTRQAYIEAMTYIKSLPSIEPTIPTEEMAEEAASD